MSAPRWYSYDDVRRRIHQVLGVEVATSTLRAARAREGRARTRITGGMPTPLPENAPLFVPVRFEAAAVEDWLATHPLRRQQDALLAIQSCTGDRRPAVDQARAAGVSWARIAAAIAEAESRPYSAQAAHKRYGGAQANTAARTPARTAPPASPGPSGM